MSYPYLCPNCDSDQTYPIYGEDSYGRTIYECDDCGFYFVPGTGGDLTAQMEADDEMSSL